MPKGQAADGTGIVLIVSGSVETLDGMQRYLANVGVPSTTRNHLDASRDPVSTSLRALVLFPDDFPRADAVAYLAGALARRPSLAVVIVTDAPQAYEGSVLSGRRRKNAIVLARPVFGWTILDAIRNGGASGRQEYL